MLTKTQTNKQAYPWHIPCAHDEVRKAAFHRTAKQCLRALANELGWPKDTYDLRSNMAGIAVSGEITLHHEHIYIQVSQGSIGVLIRSCKGRRDSVGGHNNFIALTALDNIPALARVVRPLLPGVKQGE